jgi:hypothetical protein
MKATITKEFQCAPLGHTVETFGVGSEVEGDIAKWAVDGGCAEYVKEAKPAAKLETKPANPKK